LRQRRRLLCSMVVLTAACFGQTAPNERPFVASKPEVDSALRSLQAAAGGRLPTLEGFIAEQNLPLDHLQRPHYTYSLDVLPRPSGSLVRVRAHITAWFAGPTAGESGYRELASNGRLETDLFERLEDWLGQKSGGPPAANVQKTSAKTASPNPLLLCRVRAPFRFRPAVRPILQRLIFQPPVQHLEATIPLVMLRRCANKRRTLEEVLRNQTQPTDLAAVRKTEYSGVFAPIRARRGLVPGRCSGRISSAQYQLGMGARADFGTFSRVDSWPGFGTTVAGYDFLCASCPTDCVASGLSYWSNDGRGDGPSVPACPAGGEHLPG